jgi:hypothetical protein
MTSLRRVGTHSRPTRKTAPRSPRYSRWRASDPIYEEVGFRPFGSTAQERIRTHVLSSLATRFGVSERVHLKKVCVDPKLQWFRVANVWHNAGLRSVMYTIAAQARRLLAGLVRCLG